jgi:tetratricopeptide (TPR) repeat protein
VAALVRHIQPCAAVSTRETQMNRRQRRAAAKLGTPSNPAGSNPRATAAAAVPASAELFGAGLAHHQAGRLAEAEGCYRRALAAQPNHADALNMLGVLAHQMGRPDMALELIRRAIENKPNNPGYYCNLGYALRDQGRAEEAAAAARQAIRIKPDLATAHFNLGCALHDQGQLDEAAAAYRDAIRIDPDLAAAHSNLGNILRSLGRFDEAVAACRQAIRLDPGLADAHCNLGTALHDQGKHEEAVAAYGQAIGLNPNLAAAHYNLGSARYDQGEVDEAMAATRHAIRIKPDYAEAYNNLGVLLTELRQLPEALASYDRALAIRPDYADCHLNRGLLLLLRGSFAQGWEEYEWRWKTPHVAPRQSPVPRWQGEDLAGKTILLHGEQGLGDALQFMRFVPEVKALGANVVLEVDRSLVRLARTLDAADAIIAAGDEIPHVDCCCPLMSLPKMFKTDAGSMPSRVPYLRTDPAAAMTWKERLAAYSQLRIGLCWAGGPGFSRPRVDGARTNRTFARSMTLAHLAPLAALDDVVLVSLQKGAASKQLQESVLQSVLPVMDWTGEIGDFADTAALVDVLDLVISIDTSVAHLAGALGKPVWLLNRFDSSWQWLTDRDDSPWYPTMRIFRQPRPGDWDAVVGAVKDALLASPTFETHPIAPETPLP